MLFRSIDKTDKTRRDSLGLHAKPLTRIDRIDKTRSQSLLGASRAAWLPRPGGDHVGSSPCLTLWRGLNGELGVRPDPASAIANTLTTCVDMRPSAALPVGRVSMPVAPAGLAASTPIARPALRLALSFKRLDPQCPAPAQPMIGTRRPENQARGEFRAPGPGGREDHGFASPTGNDRR